MLPTQRCAPHCTQCAKAVHGLGKTIVQKVHTSYNTLMVSEASVIRDYFAKLGLEPEIAAMYHALHTHGPQSIAALARSSGVERTKIYRLIDSLLASHLVEVETHGSRGIIKPAPIANLRILIHQKEQALHSLQDELALIEQVLARNALSNPAFHVQQHQGPEGIRHILRAAQDASFIDAIAVPPFTDVLANVLQETSRPMRCLTTVASLAAARPNVQVRHVSAAELSGASSMLIYDDVCAHLQEADGEWYGLALRNQHIAAAQRAFFATLWH